MQENETSYSGDLSIDPAHAEIDLFGQLITKDIWNDKYRWHNNPKPELSPYSSFARVVKGVMCKDTVYAGLTYEAMCKGLWMPAGRIQAGAGTTKTVTLFNCFVDQTIQDSMDGIADALKDAMLSMQQGGGIGMNFSTLRPTGAHLKRTDATASGPLPFMDMWNSMCSTIMSAGDRRGAMMAVMSCEHPDLPLFIKAKHEKGRLNNFNMSVLITDAFMDAVTTDEDWYLGFHEPRADGAHLFTVPREDVPGGEWYVYAKYKARELYNMIIQNTYEYSEPGVIFIDRINDTNNLAYCEDIQCTNPCGEQPLPPNAVCDLGAVNLARMVKDPFGDSAEFDFDLLDTVVSLGVRFLDNVIDVTHYPLEKQRKEQEFKRRIGLGITGLADTLAQLNIRYGSEKSLQVTNAIMETVKISAYKTSALLASERGPFPMYLADEWGVNSPVVQSLPDEVKGLIRKYGIRNGVLLTIAPTGTTSIYYGNVSSGLEPVFRHEMLRKVRQADDSYKEYTVYGYSALLWRQLHGNKPYPPYMVTAEKLAVRDHIRMQSVCQRHIDASVSKTINCPENITLEEFKLVYWDAYEMGCKGCTTYRPSDVRGSILSDVNAEKDKKSDLFKRPDILAGHTYKVRWPNTDAAYYITINDLEGRPFEIFISSTSAKYSDWSTALSLMISAIMRRGDDITFIPEELSKVASVSDTAWVEGKHYSSLVALIGDIIRRHMDGGGSLVTEQKPEYSIEYIESHNSGEICPICNQPTLVPMEGCKKCANCGYSSCG